MVGNQYSALTEMLFSGRGWIWADLSIFSLLIIVESSGIHLQVGETKRPSLKDGMSSWSGQVRRRIEMRGTPSKSMVVAPLNLPTEVEYTQEWPPEDSKRWSQCMGGAWMISCFSHVRVFVIPWTRLLCPWEFFQQEYWSELPCLPPGDLPYPGI